MLFNKCLSVYFLAMSQVVLAQNRQEAKTPIRPVEKGQLRCGWFSNPSPANAWLTDADGEWVIAVQGGYQAEGDWPPTDNSWIETNGHYGYGCVCMRVTVDVAAQKIVKILSGKSLPGKKCEDDKKLKKPFS